MSPLPLARRPTSVAPRQPLAAFSVGDKAVYPVHGVAEVVALEDRAFGGGPKSVYILKILETGMTIIVPTENAAAVGLRGVISSADVKEVYAILRSAAGTTDTQTWNRRYREYMDKIRTGSLFEIAEVLRDLSRLRGIKDLSFGERKMLDTAWALVVKELALAKRTSEARIERELKSIFEVAA